MFPDCNIDGAVRWHTIKSIESPRKYQREREESEHAYQCIK